ncbi:MAG TPA: M56 family metallopeptidase [Pyrinomonadaceae bacterium]|nr:M56 family metallopeptidase [Pyrinomonadaceae bacterium]
MKTSSELLLTFLLNAVWQIPLITVAAALGAWLLKQSSVKYRHWIWVAALLLSFVVPSLATSRFWFDNSSPTIATDNVLRSEVVAHDISERPFTAPATTSAQSSTGFVLNTFAAEAILAVYAAFLLFGVIRLAKAWRATSRITHSADRTGASDVLNAVLAKCQHLIGGKNVQILCSESLPVPVTVGVRKPLIILPAKLVREGDVELLTSAIAHEFIHVARRDYVLNLCYELVFVLLSFHPVATLLRRRIKQTRELLCDELVADRVLEADVYARSLVTLASAAPTLSRLSVNATVGIADADILEVRVMSLMNKSKLYPRSRKLLLIGVVLLLAVPSVTAMALAMRFDIDPFGSAITQEQESKQKEKEKEKERVMERRSAEYRDGLRAGQKEAERRKEPFTHEDEARLVRQMQELKEKGEALTNEDRAKLAQLKQALQANAFAIEDEAKLARQMEELKARDEMHATLVRLARIPMDQAIQIATSQFPGKVLQSSLGAKGWERVGELAPDGVVFYHVTVIGGEEVNPTLTHVWVNAVDGTIIKSEKELPRKRRSPEREEP